MNQFLQVALMVIWVHVVHWFADFVLQTNWQAQNKSKNWVALFGHVLTYTLAMSILVGWIFSDDPPKFFGFVFITFVCHLVTDAVTSRITSPLFMSQFDRVAEPGGLVVKDYRVSMKPYFNLHSFFIVVGFDQVLHYAQLFLTIAWLIGG